MAKYRMATLFSGAGGLDTAFYENENFNLIFANDVLDAPADSYSKNYSHTKVEAKSFTKNSKLPAYVVGDVTNINFEPIGKVDCMIGGPPCQDFSIARGGNRIGINSASHVKKKEEVHRGKLYLQYVRAIESAEPKFFAFENVPGLKSANDGLAYGTIVSDFKEQGYQILFNDTVNATKVGVPQARRRLIIIGARNDIASSLPDSIVEDAQKILTGSNSLVSKYPICAMEALEGKTVPELAEKYAEVMEEYRGVEKETNTADSMQWKKNVWDNLTMDVVKDYLFVNGIKDSDESELKEAFEEHKKVLKQLGFDKNVHEKTFQDSSNEIPNEARSVSERMKRIHPGGNHLTVAGTQWNVKGTMSNIYRRTDPLRPAFTVMAYGGGGTWSYHYERERGVLTNRERARLQTFPDKYMFEGNRSQVRAQIGEAVPAQLGRKIAEVAELVLGK
jgi:DNA (cytosine-5)-methyltransferase 1